LKIIKSVLLISIILLTGYSVYPQETIKRSDKLTPELTESFSILKSDKKLRQGEYTAVNKMKVILAKGNYNAGKRVGEWQFFADTGKLLQTFNYDKNEFSFLDTSAKRAFQYHFLQDISQSDTVNNPVIIGGYYYAFMPLIYNRIDLFKAIGAVFPGTSKARVKQVLTISAEGVLLKHLALITVGDKVISCELDDSAFDDGSKKFTPAMINHHPVACEITALSSLNFTRSDVTQTTLY